MARRNRQTEDLERDDDPIANLLAPVSPAPLASPSYLPNTPRDLFTEVEDRRTFHPEGVVRPALDITGNERGYRRDQVPGRSFRQPIAFEAPERTLVCVRRKTRREVLFAKRKNGKGARARRRRRNYYSNVRC